MKFKKQNQNGGTLSRIVCDYSTALLSFVLSLLPITNKAISHNFEEGIHTRQNLCRFARYVAKAKPFCQKGIIPVTRTKIFIWGCSNQLPRSLR